MALRFLHCSDIHLYELTGTPWQRFINKRLTGAANLAMNRRQNHHNILFDYILDYAQQQKADRLVITGDLTNLALESEFKFVQSKLATAGLPVTVIPGNHDAYTQGSVRNRRFENYLSHWMEGERASGSTYPFVQRLNGVAFIGLSTAIATFPLYATGRVGQLQLERLEQILEQLAQEGLARVILIHHPVMPGVAKKRHDLLDLAAFNQVIARHGAELILHGHEHRSITGALAGPEGEALVHGVGSGTSMSDNPDRCGGFSFYTVAPGVIEREQFVWSKDEFVAKKTVHETFLKK